MDLECVKCGKKNLELLNTVCYDLLFKDGSDKGGEGLGKLCDDCLIKLEKWMNE